MNNPMRAFALEDDKASRTELDVFRSWLEDAFDAHSQAVNHELVKHKEMMVQELTLRLKDLDRMIDVDRRISTKSTVASVSWIQEGNQEEAHGRRPIRLKSGSSSMLHAKEMTLDESIPGNVLVLPFSPPKDSVPLPPSTKGNYVSPPGCENGIDASAKGKQDGNEDEDGAPKPSQKKNSKDALLGASGGDVYSVLLDEDATGPRKKLQDAVMSTRFEMAFGVLILLNTVIMAIEVQHRGSNTGSKIGYDPWDPKWLPGVLSVIEWVFGVFFTVEIILKLVVLRHEFFILPILDPDDNRKGKIRKQCARLDLWNFLDFFIVAFFWVGAAGTVDMPIDPMLLRLARLGRLLRLLRLVRSIQAFDSLYLLTAAIKCSVSALFWSAMLLLAAQIMLALVLNQMLESYIHDEHNPIEKRQQVFRYFGTFSRALFSMFEITLGNFVPVGRMLMENVSEWYLLFNVLHKCAIGFAVLSVVRGVFMHETFKVAATDDNIMVAQKLRAKKIHRDKMQRLFEMADTDGSMSLDRDEFASICEDKTLKTWLASMELDIQDSNLVFSLITGVEEQKEGEDDVVLSLDQLVNYMSQLKGPARQMQMAEVRQDCKALRKMVTDLCTRMDSSSNGKVLA
jgi:hypothetical protein